MPGDIHFAFIFRVSRTIGQQYVILDQKLPDGDILAQCTSKFIESGRQNQITTEVL